MSRMLELTKKCILFIYFFFLEIEMAFLAKIISRFGVSNVFVFITSEIRDLDKKMRL